MYSYATSGVCSRQITFDVTEGKVNDVSFVGGCAGNLKGIAKLIEGRQASEVITALEGTTCGRKSTSCPDQLAQALRLALEDQM